MPYIYLEKSTEVTVFSCPLKHLTKDGSSAVAIVLIKPFASYIISLYFKLIKKNNNSKVIVILFYWLHEGIVL